MSKEGLSPDPLTSYEQLALLKQPNPRAPTGLRNLCLISLMLKTGIRVSELINLKASDMDLEGGEIHIEESGAGKERTLWLDETERDLLKSWSKIRPAGDFFFSTLDGQPLQDRYIREMVKRLARKAGIKKDVHPHLLRYSFAADFIREIRDVNLLKEALGHRDLAATQPYTQTFINHHGNIDQGNRTGKRSGIPIAGKTKEKYKDKQKLKEEPGLSKENFSHKQIESARPDIIENRIVSSVCGERTKQKAEESREQFNANLSPINSFKENFIDKTETSMPTISLISENRGNVARRIPPIKCSRCNFILHYQGDCPRCGALFSEIMLHWGKRL